MLESVDSSLDQTNELHEAWVADERQPQGLHFTPKVAPSFDGKSHVMLSKRQTMIG